MSNNNNGRYVILINNSTNTLVFKHEDTSNTTETSRFTLVSGNNINVLPNGSITFIYATSRWICVSIP